MNAQSREEFEVQRERWEQEMSAEIGSLAAALAKAQGDIVGAAKGSENPFFKSRYADLAQVWEACRVPLNKNEIAVIQTTERHSDSVVVVTMLAHSSGQWIKGRLQMRPLKQDPQGIGSCITYARRYALAAIVGVAQVDDDGNAASVPQMNPAPVDAEKVASAVSQAIAIVDEDDEEQGPEDAKELYKTLSNDERMAFQAKLKETKPAGAKATYWAIFRKHLEIAAKNEAA